MGYVFGERSIRKLAGVRHELIILATYVLAHTQQDFTVVEGYRTQEKQEILYAKGRTEPGAKVTWTLNSAHTRRKAIDIYPYPIPGDLRRSGKEYNLKQHYLRGQFVRWAKILDIPIRVIDRDLPHIELI